MKAKIIIFALAVTSLFVSCNEYFDNLEPLGKRVETLENSVLKIDNSLNSLEFLIQAVEKHGYITRIEDNDDGSCTIYMKGFFDNSNELTERAIVLRGGLDGADGLNGHDGLDGISLLGVAVDPNGVAYWTILVDGKPEPLRDEDGNIIPVRGPSGKDGMNGQDGVDGENGKDAPDVVLPMVRINPDTGKWEISSDGGKTWDPTEWDAVGKDGKKGQKGDKGDPGKEDPIVQNVEVTDTEVIFYVFVAELNTTVRVSVPREGYA